MKISLKWSTKTYDNIELDLSQNGKSFKNMIYQLTGVPPERQKILGLKGPKLTDEVEMSSFKFTEVKKLINKHI